MGVFELAALATLSLSLVWAVALVDVILSRFADGTSQVVWALVVIFVPFGFLFYLVSGRKRVLSGGLGFLHRS